MHFPRQLQPGCPIKQIWLFSNYIQHSSFSAWTLSAIWKVDVSPSNTWHPRISSHWFTVYTSWIGLPLSPHWTSSTATPRWHSTWVSALLSKPRRLCPDHKGHWYMLGVTTWKGAVSGILVRRGCEWYKIVNGTQGSPQHIRQPIIYTTSHNTWGSFWQQRIFCSKYQ